MGSFESGPLYNIQYKEPKKSRFHIEMEAKRSSRNDAKKEGCPPLRLREREPEVAFITEENNEGILDQILESEDIDWDW